MTRLAHATHWFNPICVRPSWWFHRVNFVLLRRFRKTGSVRPRTAPDVAVESVDAGGNIIVAPYKLPSTGCENASCKAAGDGALEKADG